MTGFDPLIDAGDVEDAVETVLRDFETTYLAAVERKHGLAARSLPVTREWYTDQTFDWQAADRLPAVYIIAGDLIPKERRRSGYYGEQVVTVTTVVEDQDERGARRISKRKAAALRSALLGHPSLGDLGATGVEWRQDTHDTLADGETTRLLGVTESTFAITLGLGAYDVGPAEPPDDPYSTPSEYPAVTDTTLTLTQEEPS